MFALIVGFRERIIFEPIVARVAAAVARVAAAQAAIDEDLQHARRRLAVEETARFIDEKMSTLQQSPNKFVLLKASISTARKDGLYCEFGV